jgi:uncharacterized protein YdhG (YjbR/CyaY superfamily)
MPNFDSVDEYIASHPEPVRELLNRVRSTIRKAIPRAEESISYKIPTYKLNGRVVLYFAAWKEHYSLYPANAALVAAFEKELAPYERSKGTIRFPLTGRMPVRLIERIAKFRAKEAAGLDKAKASRAKRPSRSRSPGGRMFLD